MQHAYLTAGFARLHEQDVALYRAMAAGLESGRLDLELLRGMALEAALGARHAKPEHYTPVPPPSVPTRLPVLSRPVAWLEVEDRVFRRICWHCHSDPDFALGDGGPGNQGGFGFAPRGVDLSSYGGVLSGGVDADGRSESLFCRSADGTPRLIETLLARQLEVAGQTVPGVRGMPLGLPALSPEDVQLVETWIAQGRPM